MTKNEPIHSAHGLSAQEIVALSAVESKLAQLILENPKVLTEPLDRESHSLPGVLTPAIVRQVVRQLVKHLPRAQAMETFILERLRINHVRFEQWEADPSRLRPGR